MICSKCTHSSEQMPRIRCTPTFFHHPIFDDFGLIQRKQPRCSATHHSTVFNQSFNGPKHCFSNTQHLRQNRCDCCCQQKTRQTKRNNEQLSLRKTQKNYRPQSQNKQIQLQKQISFNPNASTKFQNAGGPSQLSNHTLLWYDPQKQILLRQSSKCHHHGLSKERKLLQLTSCAFYPNGNAQLIEGLNCRYCQKLTSCPLCGGFLNCEKCKYQNNCTKACKCNLNLKQQQFCTCGPCKLCGCGYNQKIQQKTRCSCGNGTCKCGINCQCLNQCMCCPKFYNMKKLSKCNKCKDFCSCNYNCNCTQNCACCEIKQQKKAIPPKGCQNSCCPCGPNCVCGPNCKCCISQKSKGCGCSENSCICKYDCNCGLNCKCCPKFLAYGTCKCIDGCRCGSNCQCQSDCTCCPKNKKVVCPKQSYKNLKQAQGCECGPQCGCGPQCRCGPKCKCSGQKRITPQSAQQKHQVFNPNGIRKQKIQNKNIRKSQPVFKSVTARRR